MWKVLSKYIVSTVEDLVPSTHKKWEGRSDH